MSQRLTVAMATLGAALLAIPTHAAVTLEAYYRLGDADPGAMASSLGDNFTIDSSPNGLNLGRHGVPQYSADVPFNVPTATGDHLSMFFNNNPASAGLGPIANSGYSAVAAIPVPSFNWGIEAWVKSDETDVTDSAGNDGYSLIAYNGRYLASSVYGAANGIGLFQKGSNYVVRIGFQEKVLAPVVPGKWTHLVFLRGPTANSFYVDGTEEIDNSTAAQTPPIAPNGYLAIGSFPSGILTPGGASGYAAATDGFYGNIDDVRFFTFSPTGPGAFNPTADLLYSVPEPATLSLAAFLPLIVRRRRC